MKKLTSINQLKKGTHFSIINGENVTNYEFLCIHPHNEKYILAIESCSQEGKKLYINNLLHGDLLKNEVYVGKYDSKFIIDKLIKYHEDEIRRLTNRKNSRK